MLLPAYRKHLILAASNLAVLFVLLLLAEAGLRLLHLPYSGEYAASENALARFDRELGWSYLPGLSKRVRFGDRDIQLNFDRNGIRVPSPGTALSPDRPSVLFVGCSFTMGHGLEYDESFVGRFAGAAAKKYQAVNLGVQAYGTDQSLLALKRFAPKFNTKVVVYTFIEDHIVRNGNCDRRLIYPDTKFLGTKPLFGLSRSGELYLKKSPKLYSEIRNSYLYDLLRIRFRTRLPFPEDITRALIMEMKRYCDERGIRFILLNWRWTPDDYNGLASLQLEKIDALEDAPEGWAEMRIPGQEHPDAEAGRHVAALLASHLGI